MKRFVTVILLLLVSGLPAFAAPPQPLPAMRSVSDDDGMAFILQTSSGRTMRVSIDRATGLITMNGLSMQVLPGTLSFSYDGQTVAAPIFENGEFTSQTDADAVAALVGSWRERQNPADLEEVIAALQPSSSASSAKLFDPLDIEEVEELSCGWKIARQVGITLVAFAACGASGIGCLGSYIGWMIGFKDMADTCGWCGFGSAC